MIFYKSLNSELVWMDFRYIDGYDLIECMYIRFADRN